MRYRELKEVDREYIKNKLMPDAVRSAILYGTISLTFIGLSIMLVDMIITGIDNSAILGVGASVICLFMFIFMIKMFFIPAFEYLRRINCLRTGDYQVTDSVVESMKYLEGRIYSMGPKMNASTLVFKSDDGDTWKLPQGRYRTPVVHMGQPAWLINYGIKHSFTMDYVLVDDDMNE